MDNNIYAKVWGLAEDENGNPDWGYISISLPNVDVEEFREFLTSMFNLSEDAEIVIVSKEEYESDD